MRFSLAGTSWTEFRTDIGIDDEVGTAGSVIFQVWFDNTMVFTSGVMTGNSPTQSIVLPISNVNTLRLVVTDGGNGNAFDHGDWAGAG